MSGSIRELTLQDQEHIDILCETVWSGNDYVPAIFPKWVSSPLSKTIGVFEANEQLRLEISRNWKTPKLPGYKDYV